MGMIVTSMLDIIHNWATDLKGWRVCRIDGKTGQEERRMQMKDFNTSEGPDGSKFLSVTHGCCHRNLMLTPLVLNTVPQRVVFSCFQPEQVE